MKKKILFIVNVDWFFQSHRLPIALKAIADGYEVHLACGVTDKMDELIRSGVIVHPMNLGRSDIALLHNLHIFFDIKKVIRNVKPDIVHLVTIKPVIFGGIAARIMRVPGVVVAFSGLGYVFSGKGLKSIIMRSVVGVLYNFVLNKRNLRVIFHNQDDCNTLMKITGLQKEKVVLIRGSGVDLKKYSHRPLPDEMTTVVFAARWLRDKGIREFVAAAKILRMRGVKARFLLVGSPDPGNPESVEEVEIAHWRNQGYVEILGHSNDIPEIFANAHIVVLPSYREGLPKVLLEAAACGRTVMTTDVPGCRDAILPGGSGVLVPPRNFPALADALEEAIDNPALLESMGYSGRQLAEMEFDINTVVAKHINIYRELDLAAQN